VFLPLLFSREGVGDEFLFLTLNFNTASKTDGIFFIMKKKLKVAITGGIGSGKSSVCEIINSKGYPVIYADDISKEILSTDKLIQQKVKTTFGVEAYINNKPNTKFLADKVFSDPQKVKKINSILHPPTIEKIKDMMEEKLSKSEMVFIEAALIYEAKMEDMFDYIIVVAAPEEIRISRTIESKGIDRSETIKRIKNQMPEEKKKKLADFVIENDGTIDHLKIKTNFILSILSSIKQ